MVHRPDSDSVALFHPDCHEPPREVVHPVEELTVGIPYPLVHRDQRIGPGIRAGNPVQHLPYGIPEEREG